MQYRTEGMSAGKFYTFWFERNLQGDIVAVYNESGTKVYTYQYDAWGNCTATPVSSIGANIYAQYNPFATKAIGFGSGFYSQSAPFQDSLELMKLDGSLKGLPGSAAGEFINRFRNAREFLSMPTSKMGYFISYGFAAIAVGNTIYSCFASNPAKRAAKRGYSLK